MATPIQEIISNEIKNGSNGYFSLRGLSLAPSDINYLISQLKSIPITTLDLFNAEFAEDIATSASLEAIAFAKLLKDLPIKNLDLGANQIDDEGLNTWMHHLGKSQITDLSLVCNKIGPEGIRGFVTFVKNTMLSSVDFSANQIGDEGAKTLGTYLLKNPQIKILKLGRNKIGAEGVKALGTHLKSSSLSTLDLSNNRFGNVGMETLAIHLKDSKLETLDLSHCNIDDQGIKALAKHLKDTQIKNLILDENNISEEGFKALAISLTKSQVTHLSLKNNRCHHKSLEGIKVLAKHLKETKVTKLDLSESWIDTEAVKILANNLPGTSITTLNLGGNFLIETEGLEVLAKNIKDTQVKNLLLNGLAAGPNGMKAFISNFKGELDTFDFHGNHIYAEGVQTLVSYLKDIQIKMIDLSFNSIDDEGAKALAALFKDIKETTFVLNYNSFTEAGIKMLADAIIPGLVSSKLNIHLLDSNLIKEKIEKNKAFYIGANNALTSTLLLMEKNLKNPDELEENSPDVYIQKIEVDLPENTPPNLKQDLIKIITQRFDQLVGISIPKGNSIEKFEFLDENNQSLLTNKKVDNSKRDIQFFKGTNKERERSEKACNAFCNIF